MNKTCKICGHTGENVWRENKYYCASCGNEIDVTQSEPQRNEVIINIACPICKNAKNNTIREGKCHCSLCGTEFDPQTVAQPAYNTYNTYNTTPQYAPAYNDARRHMLEEEKSKRLLWGCVFLVLFWPVSIYHFYKLYQASQELSKL